MTKLLTSAILSAALFVGGSHALSWLQGVDCERDVSVYDHQISIGGQNTVLKNGQYVTSDGQPATYNNLMRFRFDPAQCEEIKTRLEGDLACPPGQYRKGQYLTPHGLNTANVCIDIPTDLSADIQTAEAALAAANTAAAELASEVMAEKEIAAELAAELAAEVMLEKETAADLAAELAANVAAEKDAATTAAAALAAEVMAEKLAATTAAAELAAEVIAEKEFAADLAAELQLALQTAEIALAATNTALAAKNDCNVGQYRKTNNSPCTDASTNAPCPVGQYRAEAGGDCKSVQMPAR